MAVKNLVKATVDGVHSSSVTSIQVGVGHGARFGTIFPLKATLWTLSAFPDPGDALNNVPPGAEIIQVDAVVGDLLTVLRAQEGTVGLDMPDPAARYEIIGILSAEQIDDGDQAYVNVKAKGALGDGVADDTVAVESAFAAALAITGGGVFFPTGTYNLATWNAAGLTTSSALHISGTSESIIKGATTSDFLDVNGSLEVEDVSFQGWQAITNLNNLTGTIFRLHFDRCRADDHKNFINWSSPANSVCKITSIRVEGCTLTNGRERNIVLVANGTNVGEFDSCIVSKNTIVGGTRGLAIGSNIISVLEAQSKWKHVICEGNFISGQNDKITADPTPVAVFVFGDRFVCSGNHISDVTGGVGEKWGIYTKCRWVSITGNVIHDIQDGLNAGKAISIKGGFRGFLPGISTYGYASVVANNVIRRVDAAIRIEADETLIHSNIIEDNRLNVIETKGDEQPLHNISINDNTLYHTVDKDYAFVDLPVGTFQIGETVTGGTSAATATVGKGSTLDVVGFMVLEGSSGGFLNAEVLTGSTSGATANTTAVPGGSGIALIVQGNFSGVSMSNNNITNYLTGISVNPVGRVTGAPHIVNMQDYVIVGNKFDCRASGVSINTINGNIAPGYFKNLVVASNSFKNCATVGAIFITGATSIPLSNFRITGNVYDSTVNGLRNRGYVRDDSAGGVTGMTIDELRDEATVHRSDLQIRDGAWDGQRFIIGTGGSIAYLWVDGSSLWAKHGSAPTGPTDGTVVA